MLTSSTGKLPFEASVEYWRRARPLIFSVLRFSAPGRDRILRPDEDPKSKNIDILGPVLLLPGVGIDYTYIIKRKLPC